MDQQVDIADKDEGCDVSQSPLHARCRRIAKSAGAARSWPVLAMLAEDAPSEMSGSVPPAMRFGDCATTAQIAKRMTRLVPKHTTDREFVRDNRIRQLRTVGLLDCVTWRAGSLLEGHPVPNSSGSGYRLSELSLDLLTCEDEAFEMLLLEVATGTFRPASLDDEAKCDPEISLHGKILAGVRDMHVPRFHDGFEILWTDDHGGGLSANGRQARMNAFGFAFNQGDTIPDMILFNGTMNEMRFVEAIATGGEPDRIKHDQLLGLCDRWGVQFGGTVCAYETRKTALYRRADHSHLAEFSHAWSLSHPEIVDKSHASWPGA